MLSSVFRIGYSGWIATLCSMMVCPPAIAQTVAPSQVTPELAPPARPPESPVIEQRQNDQAVNVDADSETPVTVGEVSVKFDGPHFSENVRELIDELRGKQVSLRQIIAAANDMERKFHAKGYVLARVVFPPQTFEDGGTLQLNVIDGYLERIDATSIAPRLAAVIEPRLKKLLRKPGLRLAEIERALMVANEVPGVRLRSALSQGEETGGVLLTIESDFVKALAGAQINNFLPEALGSWQFGANLAYHNVLGLGDSVYARIGGDANLNTFRDRRPGFGYVGGGLSLPVDTQGSSVAFDAIVSRSSTEARLGVPAIDGRLTQTSLRLNVLPVLNRSARVGIEVALETIRQSLEAADFGIALTRDDYRSARLSLLLDKGIGFGRLAANVQFSAGLGGRLANAADPTSPGLSRQGASPNFAKLGGDSLLQIPLRSVRLDLTLRGQTGFGEPLLLSEQFSLDSPNAISTPVSGRFLVDSGQTSRIEVVAPRAVAAFPNLEPYVFAAQGYGTRVLPTAVESRSVYAGAVGIGARLTAGRFQFGIELGSQVAREFVTNWSEHARLTVSIR